MKKTALLLFSGGFAILSVALLTHCTSGTGSVSKKEEGYAKNGSPEDSLCLVQPSWFPHSQTPAPQEGKGSPFDVSSTTNQIFHQWSWNKFLWLTKPDKGGNPLFLNEDKVKQVTTFMEPVKIPSGTEVVLQDINQAGSKSPILRTNPDYNKASKGKSETVYYSIHMNRIMYDAGRDFGILINSHKLPGSNEATFPVGSFELKAAWVPASAIPDSKLSMYYTTTASLSPDGGKTFTPTKVALIGMHVVGVVENHPEFIWATFEHEDLAPNYNWEAGSASAKEDKLLFKKGTVQGINGILFNTTSKLGADPYHVFDLFQFGVPRNSGGSFMKTSQTEPADFDNVKGINECVHAQLDDVWNHYFYNGSLWLDMDGKTLKEEAQLINSLGFNIGVATDKSSLRGSANCANVTMESFTQTFETNIKSINVNTLANCFSCHAAPNFNNDTLISPLYLSHTFQDYLLHQQGLAIQKVEDLKTKSEQRTMLRLSK